MSRALRADLVDAAVLEVAGLVVEQGWLADRALERVLRREKRLYSQERRAVAETVYGILRAQGQLAWLAGAPEAAVRPEPFDSAPPAPRSGQAARAESKGERSTAQLDPATAYALWMVRTGAASAADAARRLGVPAGLLSRAIDRADARIAALPDPVDRIAVGASLPRWIAERFVAELGEREAALLARALNERAPLTVRANTLRTTRDALRDRLAAEGVGAVPTRWSPWALVLDGHANAFSLRAFKEGLFEIQDEGSQLIALAAAARPGHTVVDACAGAGGKSLALAAEMHGKGSLVALDSDPDRLDEARRRARRAGVHNVRTRPIPADATAAEHLADLVGAADRVLVDAPCAGLGTLRRKPDARWRLRPGDPARFGALQRELVARFAKLVKPGGALVYATCSIGADENAGVAAFAERELGLRPRPLERALGSPLAQALGASGHAIQLWPHVHGTDGFYLAAFERP